MGKGKQIGGIREGAEGWGKCSAFHWICAWYSVLDAVWMSMLPTPSPRWRTSGVALITGTTCWASQQQQPRPRADASCFLSTLVEIFSRERQGHKNEKGAPAWWAAADHSQPSPATLLSAQHLPVRISKKQKYGWLWCYLRVYLIFCYLFQEFKFLLIWEPGFWQLFSLNGFMPSCQLSKDSGPRITLTGSLRAVRAEQRHGERHCIKEGSAFRV